MWLCWSQTLRGWKGKVLLFTIVACIILAFLMFTAKMKTSCDTLEQTYDILINSYMRSGSSFTGRLLGYRIGAFYVYEPLWGFGSTVFYQGRQLICSSDKYSCRNISEEDIILNGRLFRESDPPIVTMESCISGMFDCDPTSLDRLVVDGTTDTLSGPAWNEYIKCRSKMGTKRTCIETLAAKCRTAKYKAAKVLRLTLDNVETLLYRRPNLKVFHLFRDPRAIINSRLTTNWYNLNDGGTDLTAIRNNAGGLCKRMLYDFKKGQHLLEMFPDRFRFILFEDLVKNFPSKEKVLIKFMFGQSGQLADLCTGASVPDLGKNEHLVDRGQTDHAIWWRHVLRLDIMQAVDNVCRDVYQQLGYRLLAGTELRNVSINAILDETRFRFLRLVSPEQ